MVSVYSHYALNTYLFYIYVYIYIYIYIYTTKFNIMNLRILRIFNVFICLI
jgi:hypothetical protein